MKRKDQNSGNNIRTKQLRNFGKRKRKKTCTNDNN